MTATTLPNAVAASVLDYYQLELFATDGGRLELPRLPSFRGSLEVFADDPDTVDLAQLQHPGHGVRLAHRGVVVEQQQVLARREAGLYRERRILDGPQQPELCVNGEQLRLSTKSTPLRPSTRRGDTA